MGKPILAALLLPLLLHPMEVASTLYGVTMEEKGVSNLVAVQLEEVQPEPQRVSA